VSKYDLFRRRIAPIAFIAAIALIARDSCNKEQRNHATVVLDFGAAEPNVTAVDAELWVGGASFANFHRVALPGHRIGKTQFETAMPDPDGELRIDVDLGADHKHVVRRIHAEDGATVRVSLGPDLTAP
jgi:hypothetical protein